jgi:predicted TIM-barrel fold metal-dependent hydrolase
VELGVVVSFDSSFGPSTASRLSGHKGVNAATALAPFVFEGIVERFPDIRMVVASSTAAWIPHWLEQTDDLYLRRPGTHHPDLTRALPSDYLRVRPFFTFSGNDLLLRYPDDYISFSHLMWSSQYPRYQAVEAERAFAAVSAFPEPVRYGLVSGTCRGLYGLPGGTEVDLEPEVKPLAHAIPV